jgi:hypothetical protein
MSALHFEILELTVESESYVVETCKILGLPELLHDHKKSDCKADYAAETSGVRVEPPPKQ